MYTVHARQHLPGNHLSRGGQPLARPSFGYLKLLG